MKERLLVLGKASPVSSRKYEELVCVAGITENNNWRRIYPLPWKIFWGDCSTKFKKKSWIEYEMNCDEPSDHRKESRKILYETIKPLSEEKYQNLKSILDKNLTTLEELQSKNHKEVSLGVIKPVILDFVEEDNPHLEKLKIKKEQKTLFGGNALRLDIPEKSFSYKFKCCNNCEGHKIICEDWELGELYRKCYQYMKEGKYKDEKEVFDKVKNKMFNEMLAKKEVYFIVGTHYRFNTYIIIGLIYPKKED